MKKKPAPRLFQSATILLFFSGIAALIYQTIWIKQLTLVVGVNVYAVATGISGFFAGLALGSAVMGRLADRSLSPFRMYARLELGIAVLGITSTIALAAAPSLFVAVQSKFGLLAWVIPFLLVAAPASLMGGTLPPLLAAVRPHAGSIGRSAGRLYAANTAGAIVGTLLTFIVIIPEFGIRGTSIVAATLNLVLAMAAFAHRESHKTTSHHSCSTQSHQMLCRQLRLLHHCLFRCHEYAT